ncbi:DDE-type integrase/transposase/recombinase [Paraperlucidibaca sp.]|uniref:DDE-type integrase/transposase/recombinase n=1 Tax=Paraperlucidibaca sp. TaxID=2708021 RepID=UPI0039896D8A
MPRTIVTDKLANYRVAKRELMPTVHHNTGKYANNRAEQPYESTRFRERDMPRFKSPGQAQLFLTNHAAISNLSNLERRLTTASHYRCSGTAAFTTWRAAVA